MPIEDIDNSSDSDEEEAAEGAWTIVDAQPSDSPGSTALRPHADAPNQSLRNYLASVPPSMLNTTRSDLLSSDNRFAQDSIGFSPLRRTDTRSERYPASPPFGNGGPVGRLLTRDSGGYTVAVDGNL